jgi:hypothetical protein
MQPAVNSTHRDHSSKLSRPTGTLAPLHEMRRTRLPESRRGILLNDGEGIVHLRALRGGRSKLNADRHLTWPPMSDSRHKLRNARPIVATSRETKTFAVKYA